MSDNPIPKQLCYRCGYMMDATTEAYGDHKPREGDASMCLACGAITIFDKDLFMVEPTPEQLAEIHASQAMTDAQIVRAHIVGDRILERFQKRQ